MLLSVGRHCCSDGRPIKAEDEQKETERPLRVTRVICRNGRAIGQATVTKLLGMTNKSTVILRMIRSFLSVMKVVLSLV